MFRFLTIVFVLMIGSTAWSQSLDGVADSGPIPPPGYEGREFVDSRGCAYVRAGVDGAVTWVPRLGRDREPSCGLPPTVAVRRAPVEKTGAAGPKGAPAAPAPRQRNVAATGFRVPAGYLPAWTDGRLNPHRGVGTARGQEQMERIWTNTVPRRLIAGQ